MTTPQENFSRWADEHYELTDEDPPSFACRRCGLTVSYLTKHAAVRHGDGIEVMPVTDNNRDRADSY